MSKLDMLTFRLFAVSCSCAGSPEDKTSIQNSVMETLEWLEDNRLAGVEDFKAKQKELGTCTVTATD